MLNIIKLKKKIVKLNSIKSKGELVGNTRYYPPAVQEWRDSIFTFNKNTEKLIPVANNHIFNLIKSYFNMYSKQLEKKLKIRRFRKWKRRLTGNKIWVSKPELKHFNDKIIINLYIYNRQQTILLKKLSKLKIKWRKIKLSFRSRLYKSRLKYRSRLIHRSRLKSLSRLRSKSRVRRLAIYKSMLKFKRKKIKFKLKWKKIKFKLKWKKFSKKIEEKSTRFIDILAKTILLNKISNNKKNKIFSKLTKATILYIVENSGLNFLKKIYLREMLFLKSKQILMLNRLKFKSVFLIKIKSLIQAIYKKNIVFNIILLKTFNLDSNILAQIVTTKIKYRKNKPLRVIKASIRKSKVKGFNKTLLKNERKVLAGKQNYIVNNLNICDDYISNIYNHKLYNPNIKNMVLSSTKNKAIIGIKVQASGRITRRLIAQRAISKIRYKGTLKNINSSYRRLSTVILKGYEKSTLQYTQLHSKRRIGSFGLKGWINTN